MKVILNESQVHRIMAEQTLKKSILFEADNFRGVIDSLLKSGMSRKTILDSIKNMAISDERKNLMISYLNQQTNIPSSSNHEVATEPKESPSSNTRRSGIQSDNTTNNDESSLSQKEPADTTLAAAARKCVEKTFAGVPPSKGHHMCGRGSYWLGHMLTNGWAPKNAIKHIPCGANPWNKTTWGEKMSSIYYVLFKEYSNVGMNQAYNALTYNKIEDTNGGTTTLYQPGDIVVYFINNVYKHKLNKKKKKRVSDKETRPLFTHAQFCYAQNNGGGNLCFSSDGQLNYGLNFVFRGKRKDYNNSTWTIRVYRPKRYYQTFRYANK